MEDQLITFETAKLAKEKAFYVETLYCYLEDGIIQISSGDENDYDEYNHNLWDNYSAPTQTLLQCWLREIHGIKVYCTPHPYSSRPDDWQYHVIKYTNGAVSEILDHDVEFKNYEQALEIGLQKSLELLPTKNPLK